MSEVILGYSASSNITFRGKVPTGIERADWDAMTEAERDAVIEETLWDLVDIYVIEDKS